MSHLRHCEKITSRFFLTAVLFASISSIAFAQQVSSEVRGYLENGEFSSALNAAGDNDQARQQIAKSQWNAGASGAALLTTGDIRDDDTRTETLAAIVQGPDDPFNGGGGNPTGQANASPDSGGITAADFTTLIQLIESTLSSDTWQANGAGNGTMQAYPSGVYVDANGVLNRIKKTRKKFAASTKSLRDKELPRGPIQKKSDLRKVSLTRLERAVQLRAAQGLDPDDSMKCLAGLTYIQYVMIDPDSGEVIIAGPAGGWELDDQGRSVSVVDGQPVLSLDDFVVCLRNAYAESGKFGCAIVPRKKNLAATKEYISTTTKRGKSFQNGLRDTLGQQDIDVFGIPSESHAARVLVEADYHMKLVGMGIEPSIPTVPSYLERVELDANGNPPPMDVVRWWFALNYEQLIANDSKTLFEFRGPGVKVLAETEFINRDGDRIHTGKAIGPTATFARDFTKHFETMADVYPVYNELKNVFDLAIVANLMREYELAESVQWNMPFFVSDTEADATPVHGLKLEEFDVAETVESVMNRHIIRDRRNGETTVHTLIGVSGGVSFDAAEFVNEKNLTTETDIEFTGQLKAASASMPDSGTRWWWD